VTKLLYFRLALGNLWKNRQTYLPFLMSSTLLTFAMYSFLMITLNPGLPKVHGGMQFMVILGFGAVVVGLFTAIFLFYANGFLIKRRKKEMGLYSILGMEKRHIARVLRHELSATWLLSMVLGLSLGVLLTRLLFLLIRLAIRIDVPIVGAVSYPAMGIVAVLFAVLYLLLMLLNGFQVRSVSPIELLRGGQTGEREPKARWALAVVGVLFMGAGYYIAQAVHNPMAAIALFFVAVVLVIFGTYLTFLSGSIALLKLVKRNKRFFYKPRHFVTVSGMLYRMKQNAAGLASIAILCTMAMVTIGTTVAMYNGSERMLTTMYPSDMQVSTRSAVEQAQVVTQNDTLATQTGITLRDRYTFTGYETMFALEGETIVPPDAFKYENINEYGKLNDVLALTDTMYARFTGAPLGLAPDEVGLSTTADTVPQTLRAGDQAYRVRKLGPMPVTPCMSRNSAINKSYLVVPDDAAAQAILAAAGEQAEGLAPVFTVQWNVSGDESALAAYYAKVAQQRDWAKTALRVKASLREEWYALHGGFLFVGIFLGFIFLMGTAMIIYFKQISEGYQDHDRFIILQQVGMGADEVRATVRRQILTVFFLPLLVAVCHVAGSLHMMVLMLQLFGLMDVPYIALNTFLAALGVTLLYGLFYNKTASAYYRMVKFN
jgi:putative ABC transport system permease protein